MAMPGWCNIALAWVSDSGPKAPQIVLTTDIGWNDFIYVHWAPSGIMVCARLCGGTGLG